MVSGGNTATITFETPAESVTLYFRDQRNQSVLTVFDENDQLIESVTASTSFAKFEISTGSGFLVGSITLQNDGSGFAVIDDFSFTVLGGGRRVNGPSVTLG